VKLIRIIKADLEGLATAAEIVARGGVICYPTDTVYGLGCDPLNVPAVQKTMKAKGDRTKPMPILVRSLEDAGKLAQVSERAKRLADRFWPGPLTIILQAREILPRILVPDGTIGLRSPKHPICLNLLELCSGMLVGTSANLTGRPPATSAKEALDELGDQVEVILDGGRSPLASASTVVDLTQGKLVVLREGPIGKEELLRCLRSHVER
jgi:L-threonylcarbamoyladenylate synthase